MAQQRPTVSTLSRRCRRGYTQRRRLICGGAASIAPPHSSKRAPITRPARLQSATVLPSRKPRLLSRPSASRMRSRRGSCVISCGRWRMVTTKCPYPTSSSPPSSPTSTSTRPSNSCSSIRHTPTASHRRGSKSRRAPSTDWSVRPKRSSTVHSTPRFSTRASPPATSSPPSLASPPRRQTPSPRPRPMSSAPRSLRRRRRSRRERQFSQ
mmetsp:Transcript_37994/g.100422  ORF Transcript_37994/g.100422 Transcript_37994/m.100422 type:complete len:210 (+) Transcript_37994:379-1008(+)